MTSTFRTPHSALRIRPVQGRLDLALPTARPFLNLNAAMALLNMDAVDVESLWVFGHLQFVFNIASQGADTREVRIATDSVRAYLAGYRRNTSLQGGARSPGAGGHPSPLTGRGQGEGCSGQVDSQQLDTFLNSLWPQRRDTIRLSQFYRVINCAPKHALDLRREGHFGPTPAMPPLARKDSPYIIRHLAINFLRTRRLP